MRALEFLLGGVRTGDAVLTLGGEGSTHVLATAAHARRLGAGTVAVRWPHELTPVARAVARRAERLCERVVRAHTPVDAFLRTAVMRWSTDRAHRCGTGRTTCGRSRAAW